MLSAVKIKDFKYRILVNILKNLKQAVFLKDK